MFQRVPIDFCAIGKDSDYICIVGLLKPGRIKSITSKHNNRFVVFVALLDMK